MINEEMAETIAFEKATGQSASEEEHEQVNQLIDLQGRPIV